MSTCYLLHFSQAIPQPNHRRKIAARHYLGITDNLEQRLREHASGHGSHLCATLKARGGTFDLVRTWDNVSKAHELELKRQRNNPRLCPRCTTRTRAKTQLHGNNKAFKGWGTRQTFAKNHPQGLPPLAPGDDSELPF